LPKFVKPYANLREIMTTASDKWAKDVAERNYPTAEQSYN